MKCACGRPVHIKRRGLCSPCYQKWLKTPEGMAEMHARAVERLERRKLELAVTAIRVQLRAPKAKVPSARKVSRIKADAKALALYKSGLTLQEVGNRMGVTRERVRQRLLRTGVLGRRFWVKPKPPRRTKADYSAECKAGQLDRLMVQVDKQGPNDCWPWLGLAIGPRRYPHLKRPKASGYRARDETARQASYADILIYESVVEPIPEGRVLWHVCGNLLCCNPAHMSHRTHSEACLTRTYAPRPERAKASHCAHGHEWNEANTYWWRGKRQCRACARMRANADVREAVSA